MNGDNIKRFLWGANAISLVVFFLQLATGKAPVPALMIYVVVVIAFVAVFFAGINRPYVLGALLVLVIHALVGASGMGITCDFVTYLNVLLVLLLLIANFPPLVKTE